MDDDLKDGAVLSLLDNADMLFPVFANVLITIKEVFSEIKPETQDKITQRLRDLIRSKSHVMLVDVNLSFAIRVLSLSDEEASAELLPQIYSSTTSLIVRRDVILAMSRLSGWYWLSHYQK